MRAFKSCFYRQRAQKVFPLSDIFPPNTYGALPVHILNMRFSHIALPAEVEVKVSSVGVWQHLPESFYVSFSSRYEFQAEFMPLSNISWWCGSNHTLFLFQGGPGGQALPIFRDINKSVFSTNAVWLYTSVRRNAISSRFFRHEILAWLLSRKFRQVFSLPKFCA